MATSHSNLPNNQLHNPKGFSAALSNTTVQKDVDGNNSWDACPILCFKTEISDTMAKSSFTSPITLVEGVSGYYIDPISVFVKLDLNNTAYVWNNLPIIKHATALDADFLAALTTSGGSNILESLSTASTKFGSQAALSGDAFKMGEDLVFKTSIADPTTGDSGIIIYGTYRLVQ